MTETNSYQKTDRLAACLVCASHKDKGYLTNKAWLAKLRRENDSPGADRQDVSSCSEGRRKPHWRPNDQCNVNHRPLRI